MSMADEFRQSTKDFWSKMNRIGKGVLAAHKPIPASSGDMPRKRRAASTTSKSKKRIKH